MGHAPRSGRPPRLGRGHDAGRVGAVRPDAPSRGTAVALMAVVAFAVFPVTIRYGRAFQPDALVLGLVVAGAEVLGSRPGRLRHRARLSSCSGRVWPRRSPRRRC